MQLYILPLLLAQEDQPAPPAQPAPQVDVPAVQNAPKAQTEEKVAVPAQKQGPQTVQEMIFGFLPPVVMMIAIMYFLVFRPQQKEKNAMSQLKKNDQVLTSAGIYGTVFNVTGDEITIKIDDNAKMRVTRASIVRILSPDSKTTGDAKS